MFRFLQSSDTCLSCLRVKSDESTLEIDFSDDLFICGMYHYLPNWLLLSMHLSELV